VLDTLQAFHAQGHRPPRHQARERVHHQRRGLVKLLDFGVARMREAGGDKTRAGTALGTPSFMAPEQAMGLTDGVDGRADVFSMGATLYAMLSGQRLHQGRTDNEAFILAATHAGALPRARRPDLPVEVIALVDKALAWDPRNRFETAARDARRVHAAAGGLRRRRSGRAAISPRCRPDARQAGELAGSQGAEPRRCRRRERAEGRSRGGRREPTIRRFVRLD
jgi:serine/threonine protein kinase